MAFDDGGPAAEPRITAHPTQFTGRGGEYFRIWLVNLLLTIVTIGFYTPFARRRTAQYFWGHTVVAGSPLEFVAEKKKMVAGFLVLVALYLAFQVAAETGQNTTVAAFIIAAAALAPYFWGSAMRFRLNATRWRGIRLRFGASWGEVYRASWPVFALAAVWLVAGALVVWLLAGASGRQGWSRVPAATWLMAIPALLLTFLCMVRLEFNYKSLLVSRGLVGTQPGQWKPVYRDFLRVWLATLGMLLATLVIVGVAAAVLLVALFASIREGSGAQGVVLAFLGGLAMVVLLLLSSAPARAYREARMFQLVWSNVGVSRIARFKCRLDTRDFVVLRLRNLLLTLVTLGFWRPFALVSEYRMKAASVTLHVKGGLDQLAGQLTREQEGLGDAVADLAGLDLVG